MIGTLPTMGCITAVKKIKFDFKTRFYAKVKTSQGEITAELCPEDLPRFQTAGYCTEGWNCRQRTVTLETPIPATFVHDGYFWNLFEIVIAPTQPVFEEIPW